MSVPFADPELAAQLLGALGDTSGSRTLADELAATGDPDGALIGLHRLHEQNAAQLATALADPPVRRAVISLAGAGPFPVRIMTGLPEGLHSVEQAVSGEVYPWPDPDAMADDASDFADFQRRLRQLKQRVFLYLAARDLGSGGSDLFAATEGLSHLAEVTLQAAVRFCRKELVEKYGDCLTGAGVPCPYIVIGMGKLGAGELNYASDIDIINLYGYGGLETAGRRQLTPPDFFARLTRRLVQALGEQTADGRVFHVDLRLRPEGGGSSVAWSLAAATAYYETLGDTWERAAYIKARPVAGDLEAGRGFLSELTPFVFRRYLDFAALDGIRQVKARVRARQVAREAVGTDVKLGAGGIREIEFFVQAQQLIHGGKRAELRSPRTVDGLKSLVKAGFLPAKDAHLLEDAYIFLRHVEHRIQLVAEEQTQLLPTRPPAQRRLACQMGCAESVDPWKTFLVRYREITTGVDRICGGLFHAPEEAEAGPFETLAGQLSELSENMDISCLELLDEPTGRGRLRALGREIDGPWQTENARFRWYRLIPLFFGDIAKGTDPDMGLAGLTRFVDSLKGRSIYTAMLYENPDARRLLSQLFCASRYLTELLARHPNLLDELLSPQILLSDRTENEMDEDLKRALVSLEEEAWLDAIRRFKSREILYIGLREILTDMDEQERGESLARLAERLVGAVFTHAWEELTARHGHPPGKNGESGEAAVVAMGRLGSGEMGYASDLDLIFIHNGEPGDVTPGAKPISVADFFARLGRRIVSRLTLPTGEGSLYEVDMRLRPSGSSGQLVTSLAAFERYQAEQAWTWEKQALTRSRVVAATGAFGKQVSQALRRATYAQPPDDLAVQVDEMRRKMADHLSRSREDSMDLKQDSGGLVDIEFIVQYLLLAHGHSHPEVIDHNPRRALRKLAESGMVSQSDADVLLTALSLYRKVEGYLQRAHGESAQVFSGTGPPITGGRERLFVQVNRARAEVTAIYKRILGDTKG